MKPFPPNIMRYTPRRIAIGMLAILKRPVDAHYSKGHPGPLARAAMRLLAPAIRLMAANDRWSLTVHARQWMRAVDAPTIGSLPKPRRIFMLALYRGQFSFELSLAALLAWRGHRVTIGYLPKLRSPIKQPLADHPSAKAYLAAALAPIGRLTGGRVEIVDLTAHFDPKAPVDERYLDRQIVSDSVMMMLRESLDPNDPQHREAIDYFRALGISAQQTAWSYLHTRKDTFDLALIANGTTFEGAHVRHVAATLEIPIVTYEKFAFRRVRVMTHGDDFRTFNDLELLWRRREELGYTEPAFRSFAAAKAAMLMDERRRSSTSNWAWTLQRQPDQKTEAALAESKIDGNRSFVLVCTNVPYDAGYDKLTRIFPSMREWLIATVRHLLDTTDLQVVMRAHPGESSHYAGKERSEDNLAAVGIFPSDRLVVIPGAQQTNTYGLMERCKFGAVFSSTTGLEMAMMGKKVAVGADVYYGRRGFTTDADDRGDYLRKLEILARESDPVELTADQVLDARLFHFLLHYGMQWPYPWDKGGDLRDLPPNKLVRSPEFRQFLPTIDALATPPDEFQSRLAEFLSVGACTHLPRPPRKPLDAPRRVGPAER